MLDLNFYLGMKKSAYCCQIFYTQFKIQFSPACQQPPHICWLCAGFILSIPQTLFAI